MLTNKVLTQTLRRNLFASASATQNSLLFAAQKPVTQFNFSSGTRSTSGMKPRKFDYEFESKIDNREYGHNHFSFMKVLGEDYDTSSQQHQENLELMEEMNRELTDKVEQAMLINSKQREKLKKDNKLEV